MFTIAALAVLLAALAVRPVAADNLACSGTGMDWYINLVGEAPCTSCSTTALHTFLTRSLPPSRYHVPELTADLQQQLGGLCPLADFLS